jgi:hypothetical protein
MDIREIIGLTTTTTGAALLPVGWAFEKHVLVVAVILVIAGGFLLAAQHHFRKSVDAELDQLRAQGRDMSADDRSRSGRGS